MQYEFPLRVQVKVQPRAKKNAVETTETGLRVWFNTPPVDGKANKALVEILAEYYGVSKSRVRILRGETSRDKLVEITT